jgi:archaellum biogenesis protein FlaJ (TadC family)
MVFWRSNGIAAWLLRKDLLIEHSLAIYTILVIEAPCYLVSILKFGKETCTHALLSKLLGITLLMAFTSLIGFNQAEVVFYTAVVVSFIAHLGVILIILLLPKWTHDIPSAWHALRMRQGREIARDRWFNG